LIIVDVSASTGAFVGLVYRIFKHVRPKLFGLSLLFSEITLLFDLSLDLDQSFAQRKRLSQKLKSPTDSDPKSHSSSTIQVATKDISVRALRCGILWLTETYL